jgi:hypothetical protein
MNEWIALVDLPAGTDGYSGKEAWQLQVIRITDNESGHWWVVHPDEPQQGLTVYRNQKNEICRIDLVSNLSFEDAARFHNLNPSVFGSPTLWPLAHRQLILEVKSTESTGWLWTFSENEPFPFL